MPGLVVADAIVNAPVHAGADAGREKLDDANHDDVRATAPEGSRASKRSKARACGAEATDRRRRRLRGGSHPCLPLGGKQLVGRRVADESAALGSDQVQEVPFAQSDQRDQADWPAHRPSATPAGRWAAVLRARDNRLRGRRPPAPRVRRSLIPFSPPVPVPRSQPRGRHLLPPTLSRSARCTRVATDGATRGSGSSPRRRRTTPRTPPPSPPR